MSHICTQLALGQIMARPLYRRQAIVWNNDGLIYWRIYHYNDGLMNSQITSLTIGYSTVNSGTDERKHQSSAPLAFVRGIHGRPVNSPHKRPVTRKMFPFHDVIMCITHYRRVIDHICVSLYPNKLKIIIIIMGGMGICFTSVATSWWGEACCLSLCYPTGTNCVALSAVLNFDYLGECSHWGNRGRVTLPTSDGNPRYITPGTSLFNEAPPMPLRASSHPGSPNYWCAILIAHQIVMAKHGGSCVHFSGISTCGRTSRETVSHPQCPPLPTLCKIYLPIYVVVTNKLLQPLTTTWYDSLVLSTSLLKI